jgi:hypothetical protein
MIFYKMPVSISMNHFKEKTMAKMLFRLIIITGLLLWFVACQTSHSIDVKPIETTHAVEVKPIHITIDVNVKIDRALDDFFGDIDKAEQEIEQSQPE